MRTFAFGQIFKCSEVPFKEFSHNGLMSQKISEDTWILVLKESIRELRTAQAQPVGLSTMNACLITYHEDFSHALHYEFFQPKFIVRPDWIVY
jgi:hypothetical protein